ncbi:MAG: zinc ribbon domain-containing protein [Acidobacteriota bacterium]
MTATCSKCGTHLEAPWKFCPECGAGSVKQAEVEPHVHERAPARYFVVGLFFGAIAAPVFIIYGTMICLLGPWMVVGIPMILLGIASPILGPYLAMNAVRGRCPHCGVAISSVGPRGAFYCHACSQKIVVKNRQLLKAEAERPAGVQPAV